MTRCFLGALTAVGLAALSNPSFAQSTTLVVQAYGGQWEAGFREAVVEPFEAANPDVKVEIVLIGTGTQVLSRLRAEKDAPSIDLVFLAGGTESVGAQEGLFEEMRYENLKNYPDVYEIAHSPVPGYGPSISLNSFQLAYNTEKMPEPQSWGDLFKEEYKGRIGVPTVDTNPGIMFLYALNQMAGGDIDDVQPGLDELTKLVDRGDIIWSNLSDADNKLAQGEMWASLLIDGRAASLNRAGFPIKLVCPSEGCFAGFNYANVVKGTKNRDLPEAFIDMFLSPEAQRRFAETAGNGPANSKTTLPEELKEWITDSPEETESLISIPWNDVIPRRQEWTDRWNRIVSR